MAFIAHACISVTLTSAGCVWTSGRFTTTKRADTLCEWDDVMHHCLVESIICNAIVSGVTDINK